MSLTIDPIRVDVYHHQRDDTAINAAFAEVLRRLALVQAQLTLIQQSEAKMAGELDALEAQARANTDAEQAAVTLLGQLHDMLVAAQNDPARMQAVIDSLNTSKEALAAAIVADTPAA